MISYTDLNQVQQNMKYTEMGLTWGNINAILEAKLTITSTDLWQAR